MTFDPTPMETMQESWLRRILRPADPENTTSTTQFIGEILDHTATGVAVVSRDYELLYANPAFALAEAGTAAELIEQYFASPTGTLRIERPLLAPISVTAVEIEDGWGVLLEQAADPQESREKALVYLADPSMADQSIYNRAARALGLAAGWRWIGVSQFLDPKGVDIRLLGWWDAASLGDSFDSNTVGTACSLVADTERFCFFSSKEELKQRFPSWKLIDDLDVHAYAGLVYRVDGIPAGHIIALHNSSDVDAGLVEDLLRLVTQHVGTSLALEAQRLEAQKARKEARSDELTGLGNRLAFEEALGRLSAAYQKDEVDDVLVVFADLDGLKQVNDSQGHEAGDKMIKAYADVLRKIWRPTDPMFRLGGDEYATLVAGITPTQRHLVEERLAVSARQFSDSIPGAGVSYGLTYLSQHSGDITAACAEADRLLYDMKRRQSTREPAIN